MGRSAFVILYTLIVPAAGAFRSRRKLSPPFGTFRQRGYSLDEIGKSRCREILAQPKTIYYESSAFIVIF